MFVRPRRARVNLTAIVAAVAVLFATDARLSHLGHGHEPAALAEAAGCDLMEACGTPEVPAIDEGCCSCCAPAAPARPEPDGRPNLGPLKGKADLGPAPVALAPAFDRPPVVGPVHAQVAVPTAARRPLYLLNERLLF